MRKSRFTNQPFGFMAHVMKHEYCTVYIITVADGAGPMKIGVADDPVKRFQGVQHSNFIDLDLKRYWWVAGRPVALRLESAFKKEHAKKLVRAEWYDVPWDDAEKFLYRAASEMGAWMKTPKAMLEQVSRAERRYHETVQNISSGVKKTFDKKTASSDFWY